MAALACHASDMGCFYIGPHLLSPFNGSSKLDAGWCICMCTRLGQQDYSVVQRVELCL